MRRQEVVDDAAAVIGVDGPDAGDFGEDQRSDELGDGQGQVEIVELVDGTGHW